MKEENAKHNATPIHSVKFGNIRVHIWSNETKFGARFNVTVARYYRENGEWKRSDSFGREELLTLSKALDYAHSWIYEQTTTHQEA